MRNNTDRGGQAVALALFSVATPPMTQEAAGQKTLLLNVVGCALEICCVVNDTQQNCQSSMLPAQSKHTSFQEQDHVRPPQSQQSLSRALCTLWAEHAEPNLCRCTAPLVSVSHKPRPCFTKNCLSIKQPPAGERGKGKQFRRQTMG